MRTLHLIALWALTTGCTIASGFDGPDFEEGVAPDRPVLVAVTHTRIADGGGDLFTEQLQAIQDQQDVHEGFLGRSLRIEIPGPIRWTLTVWEDEESMMRFVAEGAHRDAILNAHDSIDGVRSAVWTLQPGDAYPPTWEEALERLEEQSPGLPWE